MNGVPESVAVFAVDAVILQQRHEVGSTVDSGALYQRLRSSHFGTVMSSGRRAHQSRKRKAQNLHNAHEQTSTTVQNIVEEWLQFSLEEAFYLKQEEPSFKVALLDHKVTARKQSMQAQSNSRDDQDTSETIASVSKILSTQELWECCCRAKGVSFCRLQIMFLACDCLVCACHCRQTTLRASTLHTATTGK